MTVYGNIDKAGFERSRIDHGFCPVRQSEQSIHRNSGSETGSPGECNAGAQKLRHAVPPVAVGSGRGAMKTFKHFMVRADRNDSELLPDRQPLRGSVTVKRPVFSRNSPGQILKQNIGQRTREFRKGFPFRWNSIFHIFRQNFFPSFNSERNFTFRCILERKHGFASARAVSRRPGCNRPQQIPGDNQVGIRTADAFR